MPSLHPIRLETQFHARVWGGQRLQPSTPPIGEAWIIHDQSRIIEGPAAGQRLAELVTTHGPALLGRRVMQQSGARFPLLIKLLDTADWLSLQVHPDDEQARRLEGPDQLGKTEAWHFIEAASGAQVIGGLRPGVTPSALAEAIRHGGLLEQVQYLPVTAGETIFMPAGTIHALGPGLLLYEVQQSSDLTYRVYDWDRPLAAGRALHIEQSVAVSQAAAQPGLTRPPTPRPGEAAILTSCPYFTLELVVGGDQSITCDTQGESFHALTVIDGSTTITPLPAGGSSSDESTPWRHQLGRFESLVIPAATGGYMLQPGGPVRLLKASVGLHRASMGLEKASVA